jgi:hypothetical protein
MNPSRRLLFGLVAAAPAAAVGASVAEISDGDSIMAPREFGIAVCEALGIDPCKTASITIRIVGQDLPVVEIEQCVFEGEGVAFAKILRRHKLTPIGQA